MPQVNNLSWCFNSLMLLAIFMSFVVSFHYMNGTWGKPQAFNFSFYSFIFFL